MSHICQERDSLWNMRSILYRIAAFCGSDGGTFPINVYASRARRRGINIAWTLTTNAVLSSTFAIPTDADDAWKTLLRIADAMQSTQHLSKMQIYGAAASAGARKQ